MSIVILAIGLGAVALLLYYVCILLGGDKQ